MRFLQMDMASPFAPSAFSATCAEGTYVCMPVVGASERRLLRKHKMSGKQVGVGTNRIGQLTEIILLSRFQARFALKDTPRSP